eukprot:2344028-Pyramimonas_sp.AAC.1
MRGTLQLGMVTSTVLAFRMGYGVHGLWGGMVVGVGSQAVLMLLVLAFFVDWAKEAQKAKRRASCSTDSTDYDIVEDVSRHNDSII